MIRVESRPARDAAVPRPWQPFAGIKHLDHRRRRASGDDDVGRLDIAVTLRHQKPRQRFRLGDRRRQPDRADLGGQPPQPRQTERQQIATLGNDQRMQLVEHDALERAEQKRRVVGRQQQRQLLGRGEQDVRRITPLPLPPDTGVSPVRVSTLIGKFICAIGVSRLRAISTASAFSGEI